MSPKNKHVTKESLVRVKKSSAKNAPAKNKNVNKKIKKTSAKKAPGKNKNANKNANKKIRKTPAKNVPVAEGVVVPRKAVTFRDDQEAKLSRPPQPTAAASSTVKKGKKKHGDVSEKSTEGGSQPIKIVAAKDTAKRAGKKESSIRKKKRGKLQIRCLHLRFLPDSFQEPQLRTFFSQFGKVTNCYCVRSKRTNVSKGTAYVQFHEAKALPIAAEESNGMLLGGRTVRTKIVRMSKAFPNGREVKKRRAKGERHRAEGVALRRFNLSGRYQGPNVVAALIKYGNAEKKNEKRLKRLGIQYRFRGFQEQLEQLPPNFFNKKGHSKVVENSGEVGVEGPCEQ